MPQSDQRAMRLAYGAAGRTGDRGEEVLGKFSDKLFQDGTTIHDLPDAPESDSPAVDVAGDAATVEAKGETPERPVVAAKTAPTTKQRAQNQPDSEDEHEHVPDDLEGLKRALAAARGDKRKARKQWQDTEKALAEVNGRLSAYQQQQARPHPAPAAAPPEQPKPSDIDEAGYFAGPAAVKEYVTAREKAQREELLKEVRENLGPQFVQQAKEQFSEASARRRYPDFQAKLDAFKQIATPAEFQRAAREADPYEYVYQYAATYEQVKDTPTLEDLKKKWREEWEAEMASSQEPRERQAQSPESQPAPAKPPVPKSLAGARGSGASVTPQWTGPTAFYRLFGDQ